MTSRRHTIAMAALVAAVVFGVGYGVGHRPAASTHSAVGHGYSTSAQVSLESAGWWYGVPLNVGWTDGTGTLHDGTRPACLPPTGTVANVRFQWTAYRAANGVGGRTVVQVNCP